VLATAARPTTSTTDVLTGLDGVVADLTAAVGSPPSETLVCSSAGGGLRLAVVGHERAVTAEAGHRVGLSAGAKVVHVSAGRLDQAAVADLRVARPDVLLVVGGTDGGNAEVLRHNVSRLARARLSVPVVLAGNAEVTDELADVLRSSGRTVVTAANVLPRIGVLEAGSAREAIREVFLRHVIGGKGLSRGPRFASLVRAATPDAVLSGVEALADGHDDAGPGAGDVLVVDVGGATTDVYSVVTPHGEDAELRRAVVATLWRARTVEGDLGVRWGAAGVVDAAVTEGLLQGAEADRLGAAAARRVGDPGWVPATAADRADDVALAAAAVTVGLRRHARPAGSGGTGRDLRRVRVVVGSGGVLRHADATARAAILAAATGDHGGRWRVPSAPEVVVDVDAVLFAAGLLTPHRPATAARLAAAVLRTEGRARPLPAADPPAPRRPLWQDRDR
jgi:uncharacterized protein (TIGR01319 family)